jgi:hypothetical protein
MGPWGAFVFRFKTRGGGGAFRGAASQSGPARRRRWRLVFMYSVGFANQTSNQMVESKLG